MVLLLMTAMQKLQACKPAEVGLQAQGIPSWQLNAVMLGWACSLSACSIKSICSAASCDWVRLRI